MQLKNKKCQICGIEFIPKTNNAKFCNSKCAYERCKIRHRTCKHDPCICVKSKKLEPVKDKVIDLYINKFYSITKIANVYSVDSTSVWNLLKSNNILIMKSNRIDKKVCIRCNNIFIGSNRKYCTECKILDRRDRKKKAARIHYGKDPYQEYSICIMCNTHIFSHNLNKKYCDQCITIHLYEKNKKQSIKHRDKYNYKARERRKNTIDFNGKKNSINVRCKKRGLSLIDINTIKYIFDRDDYRCSYCLKRGGNLTVDHVVPLVHGGSNDPDTNLVTCCKSCNSSKNRRDLLSFLLYRSECKL